MDTSFVPFTIAERAAICGADTTNRDMKTPRHFDKLLTSAALLSLGVGFVSLGFLPFINGHPEEAENGWFFYAAYPIIGGLISILLGSAFFAIAVLFVATLLQRKRSMESG
jgi:multisubunit Na+/H+ antiporter MnhB subunit